MNDDEFDRIKYSAQQHALQRDYSRAFAQYNQALKCIEVMMLNASTERQRASLRTEREQLKAEMRVAEEISSELRAMADPAEAVRRNRESPSRYTEMSRVSRPPPQSLAAENQILYGDPDRFGPPLTPNYTPVIPRIAEGFHRLPPSGPPKRNRSTRRVGRGGPEKDMNANNDQAQPAKGRRAKKSEDAQGGERVNGHPVYVPRSGEEVLAEMINGDMLVGESFVSWGDIGGLDEAKQLLVEAVIYPDIMPNFFRGVRRPSRGVMLYGPPGTGKTLLAKAVASECKATFFNISPATLTSKWRGESEKLIRVLFEMANHYSPSIIFIDEIDALCRRQDGHEASVRAKSTLLAEMDGLGTDSNKRVMVLGATNHPWHIDDAMKRRLEKHIYIPLPTRDDRVKIFKVQTRNLRLAEEVDFDALSDLLENRFYSCADITSVVREASMMPLRSYIAAARTDDVKAHAASIEQKAMEQPITMRNFRDAIKLVPSNVNRESIHEFETWKKKFEGPSS